MPTAYARHAYLTSVYNEEDLKKMQKDATEKIKEAIFEGDAYCEQLRAIDRSLCKEIRLIFSRISHKKGVLKTLVRRSEAGYFYIPRSIKRAIAKKIKEWELFQKQFKRAPYRS